MDVQSNERKPPAYLVTLHLSSSSGSVYSVNNFVDPFLQGRDPKMLLIHGFIDEKVKIES